MNSMGEILIAWNEDEIIAVDQQRRELRADAGPYIDRLRRRGSISKEDYERAGQMQAYLRGEVSEL